MVSSVEKILDLDIEKASLADMTALIRDIGIVILHHNGCAVAWYRDENLGIVGFDPNKGCDEAMSSVHAIRQALTDLQENVRRKVEERNNVVNC